MVLAPFILLDFLLSSKAFSVALKSIPLCCKKFWSSLQITANCRYFDILSRETHWCCHTISVFSLFCSTLLMSINGVIQTGIHLRRITLPRDNAENHMVLFKHHFTILFRILNYQ